MNLFTAAQLIHVVETDLLEAGLRRDELPYFHWWLTERKPEAERIEDRVFMQWFGAIDRVKLVTEFREDAAKDLAEAAAAAEERPCL